MTNKESFVVQQVNLVIGLVKNLRIVIFTGSSEIYTQFYQAVIELKEDLLIHDYCDSPRCSS